MSNFGLLSSPSLLNNPVDFSQYKAVPSVAAAIKTAANPTYPFQFNSQLNEPQSRALIQTINNAIENTFGAPAFLASGGNPLTGNPLIPGGGSIPRGFQNQVAEAIKTSGLPFSKQAAPYLGLAAGFMEPLGGLGGEGKIPKELEELATKEATNIPSDIGKDLEVGKNLPNEVQPTPETGLSIPEKLSQKEASVSTGAMGGRAASINTNTFGITPQAKQLLTDLSADLGPKTEAKIGGPMTNQEVIDFAKAHPDLSLNQTTRDASLKFNAAVLNARQKLGEAMERGASNEEVIKNYMQVRTTLADLGRSLQAAGIKAEPIGEGNALPNLLDKIFKVNKNVDEIIAAAKNVDFNDYNQAVNFYRQFVKPTASDWIDLVRYNSMLSSPLTLSNISAGNLFNIATQPIVKSTAGALDWLKTGIFGGKQTHFIGEGPMYVKGAAQTIGNAFSKFTDVMSGKLDPKMLDFSVPIASEGKTGALVKGLNIFSTLHNAMYQFFNTIAKGGSEAAMKYAGKEGPLSDLAAQAEADYATFRAGTMPEGQGGLLNAIDSVANAFKQWSKSDNKFLAWPVKFTLPFLRISTNMAKQMLEYSPAGFATIPGAADKITQLAKATLGTAAFATIGTMAATGNITGAEPTNAADKNAFRASGRQAYSIKIGNHWVSYNKLPPSMSIPMLLAASYMQSQASGVNKDKMQSILDAFGAFGTYVSDQSYVKNIGDLVKAMQGDTSQGNPIASVITNDAQQLVPFRAFAGWLAKALDPNQRQIDSSKGAIQTQLQLLMMQIPGLRQQLPTRNDAAGNPIPNFNNKINAISPFQITNTSSQQEKAFQDYTQIGALNKVSAAASKQEGDVATAAVQAINGLPSVADKKAYLINLAKSNPDVAKKVITLLKQPTGLNATEKKLLNASTATRAQFIAGELKGMQTNQEKRAYIQNLYQKKIATKAVLTALAKLLKP